MNKMLQIALPSALGLMLAVPAMAQGGYNNQYGSSGYQGGSNQGMNQPNQNWQQGQSGWQGGQMGWNSNQNPNQGYSQNYGQSGNQNYGQSSNSQQLSQQFVADLQRNLQQQGFYHQGNVDGIWGPETSNALSNFQRRNNLQASGQLDLQTLQALNFFSGQNQGGQNQNFSRNNQGQNYSSNYNPGQNYGGSNSGGGYNASSNNR